MRGKHSKLLLYFFRVPPQSLRRFSIEIKYQFFSSSPPISYLEILFYNLEIHTHIIRQKRKNANAFFIIFEFFARFRFLFA
ncbi:hypothetical protein CUM69_03470 [Enterococcus faecium]|nr:hypothetical protein [Enterococcus faecium]PQC81574.1 hypothetical protein CUM69_03470 [Enterococcus faecium]